MFPRLVRPVVIVMPRVLGEDLADRMGRNRIGVFFDDFMTGSYLEYTKSYYGELYRHRRPVFSSSMFRAASGWQCLTKRLVMPLTTGSDEITMAFAAQIFLADPLDDVTPTTVVLDFDVQEVDRILIEA